MNKKTLQKQCLEELLSQETNAQLLEATRTSLVSQSKSVGSYKNQERGKNRFDRKKYSKIANAVKNYNEINMNLLFKQDILQVNIPVVGESDEYTVTIKLEGVVAEIQKNIKNNNNKLEFRTIIQSLTKVFNTADVYVKCTCLTGDTKIKLLDGTSDTIENLIKRYNSGEKLYVYAVDNNGDFKPGEVSKVWQTGTTNKLIKVTLDNGEEIKTTPNHLYMLRDGSYARADSLKVGQSLMPLYTGTTENGYETVKFNSTGKYHSTYKVVGEYYYPEKIAEEDRKNKSIAALNRIPEEKQAHALKVSNTKMLNVFNKIIEEHKELTAENYEYYRAHFFPKSPRLTTRFANIEEAISYFKINHKIVKIEEVTLDAAIPVYDITVENFHNFAVDAGVILHNCADYKYRFAHWNIVKNVSVDDSASDPGPGKGIANPKDDMGRGCKHILLVLANGDWMMKVASVINNYCHYASEKMPEAFLKLIFPKLYGVPADEAAENNIVADNEDLETHKDLIDIINEFGKNRGKFQKGSNINPVYADKLAKEQNKETKETSSDKTSTTNTAEEPKKENKEEESK